MHDHNLPELENKIKLAVQRKYKKDIRINLDPQIYEIINFLPDATFAIDKQGIIIAWNKAIEEMTGVAAIDMLGKNHHEYARVDPRGTLSCPYRLGFQFRRNE